MMRRFELLRHKDISGVSGTGLVAEGVLFTDGTAAIRWHGDRPSTVVWSDIDHAIAIHGHGGNTEFRWIDEVPGQWLSYKGRPSYVDHRTTEVAWHSSRTCTRSWCGATPEDATRPAAGGGA